MVNLSKPDRRRFVSTLWQVAVLTALIAGCGGAPEVEVTVPHTGEIQESFTEPTRTRLAKKYPITMPVSGRVARIDLEPGDEVKAGQMLAEFDRSRFPQRR